MLIQLATLIMTLASAQSTPAQSLKEPSANAMTTALAFVHNLGVPTALVPENDRRLKTQLIESLSKTRGLSQDLIGNCLEKSIFRKYAGDKSLLTLAVMERINQEQTPASRLKLFDKLRTHCDLLSTQFDMISEPQRKPIQDLVEWIKQNHQPGQHLNVIAICTGNTRRSAFTAAMGNLAASYYGLPDIRFASGGTAPDAINPRTITALRDIGFEIEDTGEAAPSIQVGHPNPIYRFRWGRGQETREFSKVYSDAANPQKGYAAILVCTEADEACPSVPGAQARISMPFLDPKVYDGASIETAKYAERRDDIGRCLMCALMQARRQLNQANKNP